MDSMNILARDLPVNTGPRACQFCRTVFPNAQALRDHKTQIRYAEIAPDTEVIHFYCDICDRDFQNETTAVRHIKQAHAQDQGLNCPGCEKKFTRLGGLIFHIESNDCIVLERSEFEDRRRMKMAFGQALAARDAEGRRGKTSRTRHTFADYLGVESSIPIPAASITNQSRSDQQQQAGGALTTKWVAEETAPSKDEEFPRLATQEYRHGGSKHPDLLTGVGENSLDDFNEWAMKSKWALEIMQVADNTPVTQAPTETQMKKLEDETNAQNNIHHPQHHSFNVARYWNESLGKFKCPHSGCHRSLPGRGSFLQHLASPIHAVAKTKCQCPQCLKHFTSLSALAQHVESQGINCTIRDADMFEKFIQQLTGDITEVEGSLRDRTARYEVTNDARETYGSNPVPVNAANPRNARNPRQAEKERYRASFW